MIPLILISIVIFITGLYSGISTYQKLKEYLDLTFKIQKTEEKSEIEEYAMHLTKVTRELLPWSMVYVLCVVLFVILLYALTT